MNRPCATPTCRNQTKSARCSTCRTRHKKNGTYTTPPDLPLAPLYQWAQQRAGRDLNTRELAEHLHVAHETIRTWNQRGGPSYTIRHTTADQIATRLGIHPVLIWGDMYYGGLIESLDTAESTAA